jgi:hypothetical protein
MDQAATAHFADLSSWADSQSYTPAALAGFTGGAADYFLVAYARAHDHVVITHEQANPARRNRVMIPDACAAMGVTCLSPFEMTLIHELAHIWLGGIELPANRLVSRSEVLVHPPQDIRKHDHRVRRDAGLPPRRCVECFTLKWSPDFHPVSSFPRRAVPEDPLVAPDT